MTFVGADGARTELSATTLVNAAAKIANLFGDEDGEHGLFDVARVSLRLPVHWQRSAWLAGVWTAGRVVAPVGVVADVDPSGGEEATITTVADLATDRAWRPPIGVVSVHPLGLPDGEALPPHVFDATSAARLQPDSYLGPRPRAGDPALAAGTDRLTQEQVVEFARTKAADWGLAPGGRLLVDPRTDPLDAWLAALAVPLVAGASVVLVDGDHDLTRVGDQERATTLLHP